MSLPSGPGAKTQCDSHRQPTEPNLVPSPPSWVVALKLNADPFWGPVCALGDKAGCGIHFG